MRVSHFATIHVITAPSDYDNNKNAELRAVGMARNINATDNLGSRAENTIGTPLPVLLPGYMSSNITIEKATIDGSDFRSLGAFNPLWAHVGQTYQSNNLVNLGSVGTSLNIDDTQMFPFMFVLAVKNRVSNSYADSNISEDNQPAILGGQPKPNPFGIYVCVLSQASISMSSQQAVIMDNIQCVARPVS